MVYHPIQKSAAVLKYFKQGLSYIKERDAYLEINGLDSQNLTILQLIRHDDKNRILVIERGDCDLKNFVELRVQDKNTLKISEINYIFVQLLQLQNNLWNYGYAICDMKEENVLLKLTETGAGYYIKLADLGSCYQRRDNNSEQYPYGYTENYFDRRLLEKLVKMDAHKEALSEQEII